MEDKALHDKLIEAGYSYEAYSHERPCCACDAHTTTDRYYRLKNKEDSLQMVISKNDHEGCIESYSLDVRYEKETQYHIAHWEELQYLPTFDKLMELVEKLKAL